MKEPQTEVEEPQETSMSPGQSLRQARESAGFSQQVMADKLFLNVAVIQQIEADEVSAQTSPTFTKGYIRLYAKNLGLDPEPLMQEFEKRFQVDKPPQKLQSFSRRVSNEATDDRWMMVTYAIVAVVIALAVIWWYQQSSNTELSLVDDITVKPSSTAVKPSLTNERSVPAITGELESDESAITSESGSTSPNVADAPSTALEQASTDVNRTILDPEINSNTSSDLVAELDSASAMDEPELDAQQPERAEPTGSDGETEGEQPSVTSELTELVFTFSDDCWVNIVDATGEAIAYGVKTKGRVMPVSGYPPFAVTLGAPQVVDITYAGDSVDLSAIPAGRIARFDLPMQD